MNLWIKNQSWERVGIVDGFESLIWTKRYNEAGDFELYLPATADLLSLLKQDCYIIREDDESVMVIEKIEITTDSENGNHLIVSGRSLESILDRRIVWKQVTYRGTAEGIILAILNKAIIAPDDDNRKIDNFTCKTASSGSGALRMQFTGDNVYDTVVALCQTYDIGFKMGEDMQFTMYKGKDRTMEQEENTKVIFSPLFDNLLSSDYYTDKSTLKTILLVAGEGEGTDREFATFGTSASGINRRELYIDARDLQRKDSDGDEMTDAEYHDALVNRARENSKSNSYDISFSGEIDTTMTFRYKEDFDIGDVVTVQNEYGITEECRIKEIIESWDETGYKVIPTYERVIE